MVWDYVFYGMLGLSATASCGYAMTRLFACDMDTEKLKYIRTRRHSSKLLRGLSWLVGLHGVDHELEKRENLRREVIEELKSKQGLYSLRK